MDTPNTDTSGNQDESQDTTPSDEDAFDAAVAEMDADGTDAPADEAAAQEPSTSDADDSANRDAAPASDAAAQEAEANQDGTPNAEQSQDDPWANAPDELRQLHSRELQHAELRHQSAASRQAAADRRIATLTAEIEQLKKGGSSSNSEANEQQDNANGNTNGDDQEARLAQLREDYPDVAEPLLQEIASLREQVGKLSGTAQTFENQQALAHVQAQEGILAEKHSDWQDIGKPESQGGYAERYHGWLQTQPRAIQEAAQRNDQFIADGAEAALILDRFKADIGWTSKTNDPAPADAAAEEQRLKRDRQLAGNRDSSRNNGPAASNGFGEDDFDGVVGALAEKY